MSVRPLPVLLALFLIGLAGCRRGPGQCAVCQREECKGLTFRMMLTDGQNVETCCPRCAVHYLEANHRQTRVMKATDFSGGNWIDAKQAIYVSGSDVSPCGAMSVQRDAQGCCLMKTYDRCQPSLVAFAKKTDARAFQQQHGGAIISFTDLSTTKPKLTGGQHE